MDGLTWLRAQWDRVAGWGLILLGAASLASAATHARDALYVPEQFSFLMSGGVGGLAAAALGCALLLSAGFHDEWRRLDRIQNALARQRAARAVASNGARSSTAASRPSRAQASVRVRMRAQWDRTLGWLLVVVAVVWMGAGYRSLADSLYPAEQVTFLISSGLVALLLLFSGAGALLFADWRDGRSKLDRIAGLRGEAATWPTPGGRLLALGGLASLAVGGAVLAVGYAKAADALKVDGALDGLVVAAAGLGVILVAMAVIALRLRAALGGRMRNLLSGILAADEPAPAPTAVPADVDLSDRWTADGLRRYHRAACPALESAQHARRPVRPNDNGLEACLICGVGN